MQEQINDKTVSISVNATKITSRLLAKAIRAYLQKRRNKKAKPDTAKHGKQSLNTLKKQGASLSSIPLSDDNIASFDRIARKYCHRQ